MGRIGAATAVWYSGVANERERVRLAGDGSIFGLSDADATIIGVGVTVIGFMLRVGYLWARGQTADAGLRLALAEKLSGEGWADAYHLSLIHI